MPTRIIKTGADLDNLVRFLRKVKLPVTVTWVQGRDRTTEQNALQWLWATEVSYQTGDRTAEEVQEDWRLVHGVPILKESDEDFRKAFDCLIAPWPYEAQKRAMKSLGMGVTRHLKVPQMIAFMDSVTRECAEMGFELTDPDPELVAYQNRYRGETR